MGSGVSSNASEVNHAHLHTSQKNENTTIGLTDATIFRFRGEEMLALGDPVDSSSTSIQIVSPP